MVSMILFSKCLWAMDGEKPQDLLKIEREKEEDLEAFVRPESVPLEQAQEAWAAAPPQAGVYRVGYQKDHVVRVKTRPFMTTTISLPKWEEILEVILGDDHFFLVEKKGPSLISILAKEEGCDTSLTLIGKTGNIYPFYIRSLGIHSSHVPDIVVYIEVKGGRESPFQEVFLKEAEIDYLQQVPFSSENLIFSYNMFQKDLASLDIAPERVYSDGIWTWLDYGKAWDGKPLPAIYQRIDEVDTPVNTCIEGSKIIVHGLPPLTLKNGQKVICIEKMES
ncbi:MAG: TrbG/VirB9 family P-type conjugative transfer protein [Proteobacteria bacterium]|nr:TrbG/VirB9 family P-type conjugative transfer protein [Pseudomonadota bacterium]